MKLPASSKTKRRAMAEISASDIAAIEALVDGMTAGGVALIRGVEESVTGKVARQLIRAGERNSPFTWFRPQLQYQRGGKPIAPVVIKAASDAVANQARFKLLDAALRLSQGKIEVSEWIVEHDRWTKILHGAESALARGGFAEMTAGDWKAASERVATQYGFSRAYAEDVAAGRYGKPGDKEFQSDAVLNRSGFYANAGRCTYENTLKDNARDRLNHTHARRILAAVSHCEDCVEVAGRGWIPIDDYPEIGSDRCHSNCHCVTITGTEGDLID